MITRKRKSTYISFHTPPEQVVRINISHGKSSSSFIYPLKLIFWVSNQLLAYLVLHYMHKISGWTRCNKHRTLSALPK